jgi:hypothetical protein
MPYDTTVQTFSYIHFCPVNKIVAYPVAPEPPPADIAADPARLSMWQERYKGHRDYRIEGCGHAHVYHCDMGWGGVCR